MRLRDLVLLIAAFCLLSAIVGLAVLLYLDVWQSTTATETTPQGIAESSIPLQTQEPGAAAGVTATLPNLVTATPTSPPTPTLTPSPTPSPTPTWTPTPTATPTLLPGERLASALAAKRNGDYELAASELRSLLSGTAKEEEISESLYELAICEFLAHNYDATHETLEHFLEQYPTDHRAVAAHYYLGETLAALGQSQTAIDHYRHYLEGQDVLADLVYTRIGDNYVALRDYSNAIASYEQAILHTTDLGQQYDLREQIGLTFSLSERYDSAIESFRSVIDLSTNVYRLARLWYLIGETHRLAGRNDDALAAFEQATLVDPQPGYAYAALVELVDAGAKVDEYRRGLIDYYAESYAAAVGAFYRYIESTPDYSGDAHYYIAHSYLLAGSYDLAVQEAERAIASHRDNTHWGDLWFIRAQALASQDRTTDAVAAYLEFADTHPEHALAPRAYWEAAWLLERQGQYGDAAGLYTAHADRYTNDDNSPLARFRAGICKYRDGDPDAAIAAFRELVATYPSARVARGGEYWLGKLLWQQGTGQEANAILFALAEKHPRDYYGLRAAHMIENQGQSASWPSPSPDLYLTQEQQREQREAEDWLLGWAASDEKEDDLQIMQPIIAEDRRFRRGMELLTISRQDRASEEFESLRQDIGSSAVALYQFALLMRDLRMYASSLRATIDLIVLAPESSVLDMPLFVQRLAFPVYYSDLVLSESQTYQLDPLVMFALIRQESVFDAQITSWAGAIGLTQIMPATGEWIAEMMPWPDYQQEDLSRAYLNAKFGAWFLSRILEMTDGDIPAALAGYNGGPGNGMYWLEAAEGDPDLFVEVITRDEPQRYVQEIYRHYDMYVRLYGAIP